MKTRVTAYIVVLCEYIIDVILPYSSFIRSSQLIYPSLFTFHFQCKELLMDGILNFKDATDCLLFVFCLTGGPYAAVLTRLPPFRSPRARMSPLRFAFYTCSRLLLIPGMGSDKPH